MEIECTKCGALKSESLFRQLNGARYGRVCKACWSRRSCESEKRRKVENPPTPEGHAKHLEWRREYEKSRYANDPAFAALKKQQAAAYHHSVVAKDPAIGVAKRARAGNRPRFVKVQHRVALVIGSHSDGSPNLPAAYSDPEIEAVYMSCPVELEVDHIIPIKHPLVCGLHVRANLQVLTMQQNTYKKNRFDEVAYLAWVDAGATGVHLSSPPKTSRARAACGTDKMAG